MIRVIGRQFEGFRKNYKGNIGRILYSCTNLVKDEQRKELERRLEIVKISPEQSIYL